MGVEEFDLLESASDKKMILRTYSPDGLKSPGE